MSEEKLKPCPFCGGQASANESGWQGWWHGWVICKKCEVSIHRDTKEEAIKIWNQRVADDGKTLSCFKCHGKGEYPVPIDPDYSWDECEQHKCEVCGGNGKITLKAYEWFQSQQRGDKEKNE